MRQFIHHAQPGQRRGFTLVELLIVIVIIAILASITIVTYSVVQQRAHNAAEISAAESWVNLISDYYATNGAVTVTDMPSGSDGICLGDPADYPSTSHFNHTIGDCRLGTNVFYTSAQLYAAISKISAVHSTPYEVTASSGDYRRGVQYAIADSTDGLTVGDSYLIYDLSGSNQNCTLSGNIVTVPHSTATVTECTVDMTQLLGAQPIVF